MEMCQQTHGPPNGQTSDIPPNGTLLRAALCQQTRNAPNGQMSNVPPSAPPHSELSCVDKCMMRQMVKHKTNCQAHIAQGCHVSTYTRCVKWSNVEYTITNYENLSRSCGMHFSNQHPTWEAQLSTNHTTTPKWWQRQCFFNLQINQHRTIVVCENSLQKNKQGQTHGYSGRMRMGRGSDEKC